MHSTLKYFLLSLAVLLANWVMGQTISPKSQDQVAASAPVIGAAITNPAPVQPPSGGVHLTSQAAPAIGLPAQPDPDIPAGAPNSPAQKTQAALPADADHK
ncbi:MAG: hypothetical protein H6581_29300 [Bacteroidia bacterium]|nr:hypothetical protein [Bacteroidia bacterium]